METSQGFHRMLFLIGIGLTIAAGQESSTSGSTPMSTTTLNPDQGGRFNVLYRFALITRVDHLLSQA